MLDFLKWISNTLDFKCLINPAALRSYRVISFSLLQHPISLQSLCQSFSSVFLPAFWSVMSETFLPCFVLFCYRKQKQSLDFGLRTSSSSSSSQCPLSDTIEGLLPGYVIDLISQYGNFNLYKRASQLVNVVSAGGIHETSAESHLTNTQLLQTVTVFCQNQQIKAIRQHRAREAAHEAQRTDSLLSTATQCHHCCASISGGPTSSGCLRNVQQCSSFRYVMFPVHIFSRHGKHWIYLPFYSTNTHNGPGKSIRQLKHGDRIKSSQRHTRL